MFLLEPWPRERMTSPMHTSMRRSPSAITVSLRVSLAANFATPLKMYGTSSSLSCFRQDMPAISFAHFDRHDNDSSVHRGVVELVDIKVKAGPLAEATITTS